MASDVAATAGATGTPVRSRSSNSPIEESDLPRAGNEGNLTRSIDLANNSLFSCQHLKPLTDYLRYSDTYSLLVHSHCYAHIYKLSSNQLSQVASFSDPHAFISARSELRSDNEIIFLTGQPSPQWIHSVGASLDIEPEFWIRHLTFLSTGTRNKSTAASAFVASTGYIHLRVPVVYSVGEADRFITQDGLRKARINIERQLQYKHTAIATGRSKDAGVAMYRRVNIHQGHTLSAEQDITIKIIRRPPSNGDDQHAARNKDTQAPWTIIVYLDFGSPSDATSLPMPSTPDFDRFTGKEVPCPVVFGSQHRSWRTWQASNSPGGRQFSTNGYTGLRQLSVSYGQSLCGSCMAKDPLYSVSELFRLAICAIAQLLTTLDRMIHEEMDKFDHPPAEVLEYPSRATFHHHQIVLERYHAHLFEMSTHIQSKKYADWTANRTTNASTTLEEHNGQCVEEQWAVLLLEIERLLRMAAQLISRCEHGSGLIHDKKAKEESLRSLASTRAMETLTRLTAIVTVLYAPLSLLTSIFGMNFKELDSATLSIWWWGIFVLIICVAGGIGLAWRYTRLWPVILQRWQVLRYRTIIKTKRSPSRHTSAPVRR